jgi:hypothetical protein
MTEVVSLRIEGGIVRLSASGLEIVPWFARRGVTVGWENVMCVSPIPFTSRVDGDWKTFRGEPITPANLRKQLKFYAFQVGLNDRSNVLSSAPLFARMWLLMRVWLKPLYVEEDKPHPAWGCIDLKLRKAWVRRNGPSLLSALDLIERHAKFEHLGSW